MPLDTRNKIVSPEAVERDGSKTAVAHGRFDVLTADHCAVLAEARERVDRLVAVVTPDAYDAAMLLDESSRAQLVAALGAVDRVVVCDQAATEALIAALAPEQVIDMESRVRRDIVADVLRRHRSEK